MIFHMNPLSSILATALVLLSEDLIIKSLSAFTPHPPLLPVLATRPQECQAKS